MTNIVTHIESGLLHITLDRPEVLNALNSEMVKALSDILEGASNLKCVFIKGAGEKAFCAGGDIKAARLGAIAIREGRMRLDEVLDFFIAEYGLNKNLYHHDVTTVSYMNGITMGGGVGIAGACRYRIATEKTRWAMPEVSIGFFPDVGAAYYLARAPYNAGRYLGLTGSSLSSPADLIELGLATHYIPTGKEECTQRALTGKDIGAALSAISENPGRPELPRHKIEKCFASSSVEAILENLDREGSLWAIETAALIRTKSPTSLKIALRHIDQAAHETFDDVIARDLRLAKKFLVGDDLIEGVRAVVVDKDKLPKWNPATLEQVKIAEFEGIFN